MYRSPVGNEKASYYDDAYNTGMLSGVPMTNDGEETISSFWTDDFADLAWLSTYPEAAYLSQNNPINCTPAPSAQQRDSAWLGFSGMLYSSHLKP